MSERATVQVVKDADLPPFHLDDDDVVVGVVVIVKTIDASDRVGICITHTESMDWVNRIGMFRTALTVEEADTVGRYLDRGGE